MKSKIAIKIMEPSLRVRRLIALARLVMCSVSPLGMSQYPEPGEGSVTSESMVSIAYFSSPHPLLIHHLHLILPYFSSLSFSLLLLPYLASYSPLILLLPCSSSTLILFLLLLLYLFHLHLYHLPSPPSSSTSSPTLPPSSS